MVTLGEADAVIEIALPAGIGATASLCTRAQDTRTGVLMDPVIKEEFRDFRQTQIRCRVKPPSENVDSTIIRLPPRSDRLVRNAVIYATAVALLACGESAPRVGRRAEARIGSENSPPRIASVTLQPASPQPSKSVRAVVDPQDPDGDSLNLTYVWTLDGRPVGDGLSKLMLRGGSGNQGVEVRVVASNGQADSEPVLATARLANRPPQIDRLNVQLPALEITAGAEIVVEVEVHDDDGDEIELGHLWKVNGKPISHEGPRYSTRSLEKGDVVSVEVRAGDGTDESEPLASPPIQVVNQAPRVVSRPVESMPDVGFRYRVEAEDPDGDEALRFELEDAPDGMQIGATSGETTWKPDPAQAGTHAIRVLVDDQKGGREARQEDRSHRVLLTKRMSRDP
jgi:hypothetical protein